MLQSNNLGQKDSPKTVAQKHHIWTAGSSYNETVLELWHAVCGVCGARRRQQFRAGPGALYPSGQDSRAARVLVDVGHSSNRLRQTILTAPSVVSGMADRHGPQGGCAPGSKAFV